MVLTCITTMSTKEKSDARHGVYLVNDEKEKNAQTKNMRAYMALSIECKLSSQKMINSVVLLMITEHA